MKCKCGNDKFHAHQLVQCSIVVDGNNKFVKNIANGKRENFSVYEPGVPFGPYTCTNCGRQYKNLVEGEIGQELIILK